MPNPIADFMRKEIELSKEARRLGLHTRVYSERDVHVFFEKAADELDRLTAIEDAAKDYIATGMEKWPALRDVVAPIPGE